MAELLDLASSRITATEVLDLASRSPSARRFHFDDDDLTRIEEWVVRTGVRWGLDAEHRTPFKLDQLDANTWHAGARSTGPCSAFPWPTSASASSAGPFP